MHFRHPTDEQLRYVDISFLATKKICSLSTLNCTNLFDEKKKTRVKCFRPDLNWRLSACWADVITTTLRKLPYMVRNNRYLIPRTYTQIDTSTVAGGRGVVDRTPTRSLICCSFLNDFTFIGKPLILLTR